MKTLASLCLLSFGLLRLAVPRAAAQTVADVGDLAAVQITTADRGTVNAGSIADVLANYPGLGSNLRAALAARLQAEAGADPLLAQARLKRLQAAGVTVPPATARAVADAVEALRAQREAALLAVAATNPARAAAKLAGLLARGLPVTQATQDAVRAVQPSPAPAATPTPEPADGL